MPEDRRIFTDLTVMENLEVGRQKPRAGAPTWTPERLFALFPNLADDAHAPGRAHERRRAADADHRAHADGQSARCILLDEPSEGLAPVIVEQMAQHDPRAQARGADRAAVGAEPAFRDRWSADRAYIIEKGRIRYEGAMTALMRDDAVRAQYLSV